MAGRNPQEAYREFLDPLNAAVGCITHTRLSLERRTTLRGLRLNTDYGLAVRNAEPITLRGEVPITISLALQFRVLELRETPDPFAIVTTKYFYVLATPKGDEILAFHWDSGAVGIGAVRFPHLHVGRAVVSSATRVLPRTFHKVHVPTGFVSMGSVVRLAITEYGARPLRPSWQSILDDVDTSSTQ